jgi:hypothetical protein
MFVVSAWLLPTLEYCEQFWVVASDEFHLNGFFALGWLPSMSPDNVQGCKRQFVVDGSLCRDACGFLYLEP